MQLESCDIAWNIYEKEKTLKHCGKVKNTYIIIYIHISIFIYLHVHVHIRVRVFVFVLACCCCCRCGLLRGCCVVGCCGGGGEREEETNRTISQLIPSAESLRVAETEQLCQVKANDWRNRAHVVLNLFFRLENLLDPWASLVHLWGQVIITLRGQILVSSTDDATLPPPPCARPKRPRIFVHGDVLNVHTVVFSVPHHDHNDTHTAQHSITHSITRKKTEKEDRKKRQEQTEEGRQDKMKEKTRQGKTRQDDTRREETRGDEWRREETRGDERRRETRDKREERRGKREEKRDQK